MDDFKMMLISELGPYAIYVAGAVALLILKSIKDHLFKLLGVTLSVDEDRKLNDALEASVRRGEEKGRQFVDTIYPLKGEDKMQVALDTLDRIAPIAALSKYDPDAKKALLEATLQRLRPAMPSPAAARDSKQLPAQGGQQ
jgi:hypothetical protein